MPDEAKVHKLEPRATEERSVAAVVSLVMGLSDNAQLTFQTGFEGDESDEVVNRRLDRLFRLANRQRAISSLSQLEDDLIKQKETLAQFEEDYARVDADHARQQALRKIEIDEREKAFEDEKKAFADEINDKIGEVQDRRDSVYQNGLDEFSRGGRTGAYHPRGATADQLNKIDIELKKLGEHREQAIVDFALAYARETEAKRGALEQADQDRDQALSGLNISMKRYREAIEATQAKLAKARAQAEG